MPSNSQYDVPKQHSSHDENKNIENDKIDARRLEKTENAPKLDQNSIDACYAKKQWDSL